MRKLHVVDTQESLLHSTVLNSSKFKVPSLPSAKKENEQKTREVSLRLAWPTKDLVSKNKNKPCNYDQGKLLWIMT